MSQYLSTLHQYVYGPSKQHPSIQPKNENKTPFQDPALAVCPHCQEIFNRCLSSQVDHDQQINEEVWAISVLILKSKYRFIDFLSHHAILIIEGFKSSRKFWKKAHLMGQGTFVNFSAIRDCFSGHSNVGKVEITEEKYSPLSLTLYKPYRQTWTRPREKIEQMLLEMKWDQKHPESIPFRLLGERSIVARKKEFIDTRHDSSLAKIESENPSKFKQLCYLFQNKHFLEGLGIKWHLKNIRIYPSYFLFYVLKLIKISHLSIGNEEAAIKAYFTILSVIAIYNAILIVSLVRHIKNYRAITHGLKENHENLSLLQEKAKISVAISQNCFNWARKHLKTLDIHLLEKLITIPELYLPKKT